MYRDVYTKVYNSCNVYRTRSAKAEGVTVVDVNGTYFKWKRQGLLSENLNVALLPIPNFPLHGWESVDESNADVIAKQLPCVLPTTLYTYLAEGIWNARGSRAFRALKRGYVHWASGRINHFSIYTLFIIRVTCITIISFLSVCNWD